jgi:hypothetical protein
LEHYIPRWNTVTSASYSVLLKKHLRPVIKTKWRGLLSAGVILHHDNARPHTARATAATIEDLHFESPYSPDLGPGNITCLDRSSRHWRERSSERMKRYIEWCVTGCTANQKNFSPTGVQALCVGELVLSVGEIM